MTQRVPAPTRTCIYCDAPLTTRTVHDPKTATVCAMCQRALDEQERDA